MNKRVNLADKKEAFELLRKLYGHDKVKDDKQDAHTVGEAGTDGVSDVAELSPVAKGILLQK